MGWTLTVVFAAIDAVRWFARRAGALGGMLVLAAFANLAWHLLPPYVQHYRFKDEVVSLAAAPTYDDGRVHGEVLRAAERRRIPLEPDRLEVRLENNERTVRCRYEVPVTLLPRQKPQLLRFSLDVVQPAFARDETGPQ